MSVNFEVSTVSSEVQSLNTSLPVTRSSEMSIDLSDVQPANAESLAVVRRLEFSIVTSDEQFSNALLPMVIAP